MCNTFLIYNYNYIRIIYLYFPKLIFLLSKLLYYFIPKVELSYMIIDYIAIKLLSYINILKFFVSIYRFNYIISNNCSEYKKYEFLN